MRRSVVNDSPCGIYQVIHDPPSFRPQDLDDAGGVVSNPVELRQRKVRSILRPPSMRLHAILEQRLSQARSTQQVLLLFVFHDDVKARRNADAFGAEHCHYSQSNGRDVTLGAPALHHHWFRVSLRLALNSGPSLTA